MSKINYQYKLDGIINSLDKTPSLLLHSCCAPCSSYCIEYLSQYFSITILYYNPNISPKEEFDKRAEEQRRLISQLPAKNPVSLVVDNYNSQEFYSAVKGLEHIKEGGERCFACYKLRLERTAKYAKEYNFDYFCTTLSISPLKNAQKLNEIGERLSEEFKVPYLVSDFKKKNGYLRSIRLSEQFQLYRQDYCGCIYSKAERRRAQKQKEQGDL